MNIKTIISGLTIAFSILVGTQVASASEQRYRSYALSHIQSKAEKLSFKLTNPGTRPVMVKIRTVAHEANGQSADIVVMPESMILTGGSRRTVNITVNGTPIGALNYKLEVEEVPYLFASAGAIDQPERIKATTFQADLKVATKSEQVKIQANNLKVIETIKAVK